LSEGAATRGKKKKAGPARRSKKRAEAQLVNRGLFGGGCCTGDPATMVCSQCGYAQPAEPLKLVLPMPCQARDKQAVTRIYSSLPKELRKAYEDWLQILKPFEKHPMQAANLAVELTGAIQRGQRPVRRFYAACDRAAELVKSGKRPQVWYNG
jgi:hypothetical protein